MLTEISMANQQIGDRVYFIFLGSLKNAGCSLKKIDVSGNKLSCLAATLTFELLDKAAYNINFSNNPIGDSAIELIS